MGQKNLRWKMRNNGKKKKNPGNSGTLYFDFVQWGQSSRYPFKVELSVKSCGFGDATLTHESQRIPFQTSPKGSYMDGQGG